MVQVRYALGSVNLCAGRIDRATRLSIFSEMGFLCSSVIPANAGIRGWNTNITGSIWHWTPAFALILTHRSARWTPGAIAAKEANADTQAREESKKN